MLVWPPTWTHFWCLQQSADEWQFSSSETPLQALKVESMMEVTHLATTYSLQLDLAQSQRDNTHHLSLVPGSGRRLVVQVHLCMCKCLWLCMHKPLRRKTIFFSRALFPHWRALVQKRVLCTKTMGYPHTTDKHNLSCFVEKKQAFVDSCLRCTKMIHGNMHSGHKRR